MTDANVVLGFMPGASLADGEISVSAELAEEAVERVAGPLGLSTVEAARGIHAIANARMTRALRSVSSEKGRDPRDFALVAYGGAGPIHAAALADELGSTTVLVPPLAGLFSAIGLLFARPEFHDVRPCNLDARAPDLATVESLFAEMEASLLAGLPHLVDVEWVRTAELRYEGQSWEVEVELPEGPVTPSSLAELVARFEDEHELLYGVRGQPGSHVQLRALRLAALGPQGTGDALAPDVAPPPTRAATRQASFADELLDVAVRTRASVGSEPERGPVLVDEYDTTVVVPPGWTVRREPRSSTLILAREAA